MVSPLKTHAPSFELKTLKPFFCFLKHKNNPLSVSKFDCMRIYNNLNGTILNPPLLWLYNTVIVFMLVTFLTAIAALIMVKYGQL
jgi:hypothetical protein